LPIHFSGFFQSFTIHGIRGVFRQAALALRMIDVVQNVDDVRAAHAGRIVHARVFVRRVFTKLSGARFGQILHVSFGAEMQAAGGAGFDAGRLEARAHAVRTERALVNLMRRGIDLRNIDPTLSRVLGCYGNATEAACTCLWLEQHFKIEPVPAMIVSEEDSVLRIGHVVVNRQRGEMVRQVKAGY
jgi:hypothetical protein